MSTVSLNHPYQRSLPQTGPIIPDLSPIQTTQADAKKQKYPSLSKAPIVISYRGHQTFKDGQGMLYDHMCFQISTRYPTVRTQPQSVDGQVTNVFTSAINQHTVSLLEGVKNAEGKKIPALIQDSTTGGLLVIPGRVRAVEDEQVRLKHEARVIREALKRGQPILAVCAGAWRVWEQVITSENRKNALINVTDHNYSGGMLRLDQAGKYATYNVQIHDVKIERASFLESSMRVRSSAKVNRLSVNSVHWKAVNPDTCPLHFRISAWSQENPSFERKTRQKSEMHPQENTPEAFESIFGAPIFGIQWHPEGYTAEDKDYCDLHINLLCYMAKAGDAYQAKRRMLRELLTKVKAIPK